MEKYVRILRSNTQSLGDFKRILEDDPSSLIRAMSEFPSGLDTIGTERLTALGLRAFFRKYCSDEQASRLVSQLMGLTKFIEDTGISRNDAGSLIDNLFNESDLGAGSWKNWICLSPYFKDILLSERMYLIFKASQLYFEMDGSVDSIRILTELRPVFSRNADIVEGYIIRNVFRVVEGDVEHEFSISSSDLEKLLAEAGRARQKISTMKSELEKSKPGMIAIYGDKYE